MTCDNDNGLFHNYRGTHVMVTGASGYIGSWLARRLLERGYIVHAAALDLDDNEKIKPILEDLPPSLVQNLRIFKANVLVDGDFDAAVEGCEGVFHLASPIKPMVEDYQRDMVDPAVNGTLNVLKSCIRCGTVKRFIHTSSISTMFVPGQVVDESHWTNVDPILEKRDFMTWEYVVSKVLSEKVAIEFAQEHDLDLVVINPSFVLGPFTLSSIPESIRVCLAHLIHEDARMPYDLDVLPCVHIEDVSQACVLLYENPHIKVGRYICNNEFVPMPEIANIVRSKHPDVNLNLKRSKKDHQATIIPHGFDSSKLKRLGFVYNYNIEEMVNDSLTCCKEKGLLKQLLK